MELLLALPEDKRQQLVERTLLSVQHIEFSGPLPTPAAFEHYNGTLPDAANRIMQMA